MDEGRKQIRVKAGSSKINWPLVRKFEALVFASMLIAIPFFAFRIVDTTGTALMVQNTAVDLVKDLIRAKDTARDFHLSITVSSTSPRGSEPASYSIQNGQHTIEQVILPYGVNIGGSITFDENGLPSTGSSFFVSKGSKTAFVDIDNQGQTSLH